MTKKLSEVNARALANLTQQQRLHWSTMITTLMGFTAVINVGIWSYFLSEYINVAGGLPSYILIGSAVSSVTLGLWRIYSRYIDNQIAALYPELVLYEARMTAPLDLGTSGYLVRNVPNLKPIFEAKLTEEKRSKAIAMLVESKSIGNRGHKVLDLATLSVVIILFIGTLLSLWRVSFLMNPIYIICLIGIVSGLVLVIVALCHYQSNPSPELVEDVLQKLSSDVQTDA
jgi:hypothetical protein